MEVNNDDNKPSISGNAAGTNDDCFLTLKLSEDDPYFGKKKKLLQEKGFAATECIYVHNTSTPDSVSATLDALLQRARIILLNNMELYFGPTNVDRAQDFYSPRNEIEALNYIISLVDHCIKNNNHENKASLQDLRDTTIKRIDNFGENNNIKTRVLKEACDSEKHLMQWAEGCGVKSKLQIAYVEGAGRGALAVEDLGVGEIALEIPVSVIISEDLVYETDMIHIFEKIDGIPAETMLLIWSMRERHNTNSKHKIYFDTLPEEFNTGLSFGLEAMMALDETLVSEEIFQAKEHLRSRYDELFPALSKSYPDVFPPKFYTWERYIWACELWYSNSMRIMFPDGKLRTCLVPVAGFLNHSVRPHILHYGKVDAETNTLKFPLSRPCKLGEQCYLSYGNLPSSHFLTFYGFLPQEENPFDVIPLDIDTVEDCSSVECHPASDTTTTHMVRGTWLSANQDIFYYGLPSPLLDHLRKVQSPGLQTMTMSQENLENDIRVLESLCAIFEDMMNKLGDSLMEDRENVKWDVQLAIQYKDLQRNIVSSIVTACHTGRRRLEHELEKCR